MILNSKCYSNMSVICKCHSYRIVAVHSGEASYKRYLLVAIQVQNRYICTEPTQLYRTDTTVQDRYICTEPIYLYRTNISVQDRYICSGPIYLFRTDITVQNRYICTGPTQLYRTDRYHATVGSGHS